MSGPMPKALVAKSNQIGLFAGVNKFTMISLSSISCVPRNSRTCDDAVTGDSCFIAAQTSNYLTEQSLREGNRESWMMKSGRIANTFAGVRPRIRCRVGV